jgi:hypothetical protein
MRTTFVLPSFSFLICAKNLMLFVASQDLTRKALDAVFLTDIARHSKASRMVVSHELTSTGEMAERSKAPA